MSETRPNNSLTKNIKDRWDKIDLIKFKSENDSLGYLFNDISLGNGTQFKVNLIFNDDRLILGIYNKGCYEFSHFVHYSYLKEKLNLLDADAKNLADFINVQLDVPSYQQLEQGIYHDEFCRSVVYE